MSVEVKFSRFVIGRKMSATPTVAFVVEMIPVSGWSEREGEVWQWLVLAPEYAESSVLI